MLTLLTVIEDGFLILHRLPKCQKLPLNRLPKQTDRVSLSMGTHDLRFLRNFFANLRVFFFGIFV